jgi:hypothetical protein
MTFDVQKIWNNPKNALLKISNLFFGIFFILCSSMSYNIFSICTIGAKLLFSPVTVSFKKLFSIFLLKYGTYVNTVIKYTLKI